MLAKLHGHSIGAHLQEVAIVECYRTVATHRQIMAIDVGAATAVDHTKAPLDHADIAVVRPHTVLTIHQTPIRCGTSNAAALRTKAVTG